MINRNERKRLTDLNSYAIMDTLPEQVFDDITLLASEIFNTPIALISLVDDKRQWFKSKIGLDADETTRDIAFCAHAIYQSNIFVVSDATKDIRFKNNPLVTGNPQIRFYAGAPLRTKEGNALGTLCVIDQKARTFSQKNQDLLNALARQAMSQLELRKANKITSEQSARAIHLQSCLKALNVGVWEWDLQTNDFFWNDGMYSLYGVDPKKFFVSYENWKTAILEKDRMKVTKNIQDALQGIKKFDLNFRIKSPLIGIKNISAKGEIIFSNEKKPLKMIGINWDISKDTEREEFLKGIFESSFQPILTLNFKGNFTRLNKAFADLLGYQTHEIIGKNIADFTHLDDIKINLEQIKKKIENKDKTLLVTEKRYLKADGEIISVLIRSQLISDLEDNPAYFLTFVTDLSEQKKAQNALIESRELERKANNAKSEFLSNMSHEIRTPLNGIIGMADLLKDTKLDTEQEKFTLTIINSGKLLLELINDILDFSKIESGKMELENIETNLKSMLDEIIIPHSFKCKTKGIFFEFTMQNFAFTARLDQNKLAQILNNLLSNAIKFTEKGLVKFTVNIDSETEKKATILFCVQDSGIGISKTQQQKLFTAFTQAENSISRKFGGTGLGLSIVKKLVEMMGGNIELESEEGKGSTFIVRLSTDKVKPLNEENCDLQTSDHIPSKTILEGNILVAEDNLVNQNIITKMLSALGCTVTLVNNGHEALRELQKQNFDLILMDCRMPEMDGFEATKAIRNGSIQQEITIVALTANASSEDKKQCLEAGMNDFISKPITKRKLFNSLEKYLKNTV